MADSIRVLVVDDFEPFRRLFVSILQKCPDIQTISEASDGIEGVRKAEDLRPDLILMDIGLPRMDGIEAARRILSTHPSTKIIYVTQVKDKDVARTVLRLGAYGYVLKAHIGDELLSAVLAVLGGNRFVSAALEIEDSGWT